MRKVLILGLMCFVLFLATGCTSKNQNTVSTGQGGKVEQKGNIITSIKDAISQSMAFKCVYKKDNNNSTVYVKDKKMRLDGIYANKTENGVVIKDNKIWSWDKIKKEGFIMTINIDEANKDSNPFNPENITKELEAQKQYCQPTVVSDSVFDVPNDVKFEDLSKMMENLPGIKTPTTKVTIPVVSTIPSVTINSESTQE